MGCGIHFKAIAVKHFPVAAFFSGHEKNHIVVACEMLEFFHSVSHLPAYGVIVLEWHSGCHAPLDFVYYFFESGERLCGL